MKAERLYYPDPHLVEFDATITAAEALADGRAALRLDRTAFYPTSGGQPFDLGTLNDSPVVDVIDADDGDVVHLGRMHDRLIAERDVGCAGVGGAQGAAEGQDGCRRPRSRHGRSTIEAHGLITRSSDTASIQSDRRPTDNISCSSAVSDGPNLVRTGVG